MGWRLDKRKMGKRREGKWRREHRKGNRCSKVSLCYAMQNHHFSNYSNDETLL